MKKKILRVVIVGAGFFGTKRLAACLALPDDFRVIAVIDPDKNQRDRITNEFYVPAHPNFTSLTQKADLAIIATPNAFHAPMSIKAMKRGMHVLCEKPLATTVQDARRIVSASKRYKKLVKTGSNHRFFHTVEKAKSLFESGAIGKLLHFKGSVGTNGSRVSNNWFWNREISGGGTFIDNGCHLLDIARMFLGDFTRVTASMDTILWKKSGVEDIGTAIYHTRDNRQAVISSSWFQWAGYLHIELWGDKGYIIIDSTTHDTVTIGGKDGLFTTYDYSNEPKDSYHRELLYVADCIRKNTQPKPSADDGACVISMIAAAYQSSKKRTWIPIS